MVHLTLQPIQLGLQAFSLGDGGSVGIGGGNEGTGGGGAGAGIERRKHLHGIFNEGHVLLADFFQGIEGEDPIQCLLHIGAHLFFIALKGLHGMFQVAGYQTAQLIAVETDQLAQKSDGQQVLAALGFFFHNNLRQNRAGDVFAGLGVKDDKIGSVLDHLGQMFQRHIA